MQINQNILNMHSQAILKEIFVEDRLFKFFPNSNQSLITFCAIAIRAVALIVLNNISLFIGIFQDPNTIYTKLIPTILAQLSLKAIDAMGATQSQEAQAKAAIDQAKAAELHDAKLNAILNLIQKDKAITSEVKERIIDIASTDEWPPLKEHHKPVQRNPNREALYNAQWLMANPMPPSPQDPMIHNYGSI